MSSIQTSRRGFFLVLFASMCWGTVGVANQWLYASGPTNALSLAFWRLALGLPFFLLAGFVRLRGKFWRIRGRDLALMALMGCLLALSQACYVAALATTGVGIATLIAICASPVLVALLAGLSGRERLTGPLLLALLAALAGTGLLVLGGNPGQGTASLAGIALALLSAAGYAGFVFCGRLLTDNYHPLQISAVAFTAGTLLLLLCASATDLTLSYSPQGWLLLLYLGSIPTALGYGLFQVGIQSLPATLASIITMGEPLTAALLAWGLLHERLGLLGLLGALLLLASMVGILLLPAQK